MYKKIVFNVNYLDLSLVKNIYNYKELNMKNKQIKKYLFRYCKNIIGKISILEYNFNIYKYKWHSLCKKLNRNRLKNIKKNNKNNSNRRTRLNLTKAFELCSIGIKLSNFFIFFSILSI